MSTTKRLGTRVTMRAPTARITAKETPPAIQREEKKKKKEKEAAAAQQQEEDEGDAEEEEEAAAGESTEDASTMRPIPHAPEDEDEEEEAEEAAAESPASSGDDSDDALAADFFPSGQPDPARHKPTSGGKSNQKTTPMRQQRRSKQGRHEEEEAAEEDSEQPGDGSETPSDADGSVDGSDKETRRRTAHGAKPTPAAAPASGGGKRKGSLVSPNKSTGGATAAGGSRSRPTTPVKPIGGVSPAKAAGSPKSVPIPAKRRLLPPTVEDEPDEDAPIAAPAKKSPVNKKTPAKAAAAAANDAMAIDDAEEEKAIEVESKQPQQAQTNKRKAPHADARGDDADGASTSAKKPRNSTTKPSGGAAAANASEPARMEVDEEDEEEQKAGDAKSASPDSLDFDDDDDDGNRITPLQAKAEPTESNGDLADEDAPIQRPSSSRASLARVDTKSVLRSMRSEVDTSQGASQSLLTEEEKQSAGARDAIIHQLESSSRAAQSTAFEEARAYFEADQVDRSIRPEDLTRFRFKVLLRIAGVVARREMDEELAKRATRLLCAKVKLLSAYHTYRIILLCLFEGILLHEERLTRPEPHESMRACQRTLLTPVLLACINHALTFDAIPHREEWNDGKPFTAAKFQDQIVHWLCEYEWDQDMAESVLTMMFNFNLTPPQERLIVEHFCLKCMPRVGDEYISKVCFPLLVMSSRGHRDLAIRALAKRVQEIDEQTMVERNATATRTLSLDRDLSLQVPTRTQFDIALQTTLLQWEVAVKLDAPLGAQLFAEIKNEHVEYGTFVFGMMLQISNQSQWQKLVFDQLSQLFLLSFSRDPRSQSSGASAWLSNVCHLGAQSAFKPVAALTRLLDSNKKEQNMQLLANMMRFGFALMDAGSQHADRSTNLQQADDSVRVLTPHARLVDYAKDFLFRLFQAHAVVKSELVTEILDRVEHCSLNPAGVPALQLLQQLIEHPRTQSLVLEEKQRLMSTLEWLQCFPLDMGLFFLRALAKLLRIDAGLRDFTVRTIHKLAFATHLSARLLAVDAYFLLCETPFQPNRFSSGGGALPASSQAAPSQGGSMREEVDLEFFLKCKDIFKRALSYQSEVRAHVYKGLLRLFEAHSDLRTPIMDLLQSHFKAITAPKASVCAVASLHASPLAGRARAPLSLDLAVDVTSDSAAIVEPLPLLISTIQRALRIQLRSEEEVPEVGEGAVDFTPDELESIDPSLLSTALMKVQMDQLLARFLRSSTLGHLGIDAALVQEATMDNRDGVRAILHAELLHGVLLAFMEWQLETRVEETTTDAHPAEGHAASGQLAFPPEACRDFIKIFDLFWQLHSLLAVKPAKVKEPGAAKKSSAKAKKKKKKPDEEDDEEDQPEDEDEEDEEEEDDDDDGEERKSSSSKKKSSSAAKGKKKGPAKPKAVAVLCRGRNKLHLNGLTPSAVIKLLRLATPGEGAPMAEAESAHRPTLVLNAPPRTTGTVGDALSAHQSLQHFVMLSTRDYITDMYESTCLSSAGGDWVEAAKQVQLFAPFLMTKERTAIILAKHQDQEAIRQKSEKAAKPKFDKKESLVSIVQSALLAAFRLFQHVGFSWFQQFLFSLLGPDKQPKVLSGTVIVWAKLMNWITDHYEKSVGYFLGDEQPEDEDFRHYRHREAHVMLDTLQLMYDLLRRWPDKLGAYSAQITDKRQNAMARISAIPPPQDGYDPTLTPQLLELRLASYTRDEDRDQFLINVCHRVMVLGQGEDSVKCESEAMEIECISRLTAIPALTWLLKQMAKAIDEVAATLKLVRTTNARLKAEPAPASDDDDEGGQQDHALLTVERCAWRLNTLNKLFVNLCQARPSSSVAALVLRSVQKYYRTLTLCARALVSLKATPRGEFRKLVRAVYVDLRPTLNEMAAEYAVYDASTEISVHKRPSKAKAKPQSKAQITSKLTKQGQLMVQHVRVLEGFDASITAVDRMTKTSTLAQYIPPEDDKIQVFSLAGVATTPATARIKHERASPNGKPSLWPAAHRSPAVAPRPARSVVSPVRPPHRPANETRLQPRASQVPREDRQVDAMEIDNAEDDEPVQPCKDEIQDDQDDDAQ